MTAPLSSTTPTGVEIVDCPVCRRRHPITRTHCGTCGRPHLFPCERVIETRSAS